jgi:hypothetical protein
MVPTFELPVVPLGGRGNGRKLHEGPYRVVAPAMMKAIGFTARA